MPPLLLLLLVSCLATSFLMSGMEAGVFALSRLRIRQQMRAGNPRAQVLHDYLEKPENFLWTILVGNTVANFLTASIGVIGLHYWLGEWPVLFWLGFLVAGVTFYSLFELLPKMLCRQYPNRLCLLLVTPFRAVHFVVRPLVALSALLARKALHGTGARPFTGNLFGNRDELRLVMQESAQGFTSEERAMINRVLDLQNLTVGQITVPMSKAVTVTMETPVKQLLAFGQERGFTRLPVWKKEGTRGRIAGLVSLKSLLYQADLDMGKTAGDYLNPAFYLDSETRLEVALQQMQRHGQRLAIVLGPDRSELGLVSLQDILKFVFGHVSL